MFKLWEVVVVKSDYLLAYFDMVIVSHQMVRLLRCRVIEMSDYIGFTVLLLDIYRCYFYCSCAYIMY